ncbi:MAG: hypothetical protein U0X93_03870 [Anaerolineales bacterium]
MKVFYLFLIALLIAGCGPSAEQITATSDTVRALTQTAAPTLTPTTTFTPTVAPSPTITLANHHSQPDTFDSRRKAGFKSSKVPHRRRCNSSRANGPR